MKTRFLRKVSSSAVIEVLEVQLNAHSQDSGQASEADVVTFRVTRHDRVIIVLWEKTKLGDPNSDFAKLVFQQVLRESVLMFVSPKGDSWQFEKERVAVAQ